MPAPQRPAPRPPTSAVRSAGQSQRPPPAAPTTGQIPRPAAASGARPAPVPPRPVTKQIPNPATRPVTKPVTKPVTRPDEPRSIPSFAEDAEDLQNASGIITNVSAHASAAGRGHVAPATDGRVQGLALLSGALGLGLAVVVVLWVMAWRDAGLNASRLAQANDAASATRGEMERSTYAAHLARVRNGSLVLAYAVDQLDASRVAGTLRGGGMGMLKEASEALGAVAHAQTGLTEKVLIDLKAAHALMKELGISTAQDKAISAVISAGTDVAALQSKALGGLEENQLDAFAASIAKVRADFTKAYRELAEIARF